MIAEQRQRRIGRRVQEERRKRFYKPTDRLSWVFSAFLAGSAVRRKLAESILPPTHGPDNRKFALPESKSAVSNGKRELEQLLTSHHGHRFIHHQRHHGGFIQGLRNAIHV